MFITNRFIFIHNRHCGGHTIRQFLNSVFPNHNLFPTVHSGHWHKPIRCFYNNDYYGRKVNIPNITKKKLSFAFIRNPWDWYVTFFHHQDKDNEFIINYCPKTGRFAEFLKNILNKNYNKKIKETLFWPPGDSEKHLVPKAKWLSENNFGFYTLNFIYMFFQMSHEVFNKEIDYNEKTFNSLLTIDKLYKVEDNIQAGIEVLLNKCNIELGNKKPLDILNKRLGAKHRNHYSTFYDKEMKELVYKKDKLLINKYGYNFETIK